MCRIAINKVIWTRMIATVRWGYGTFKKKNGKTILMSPSYLWNSNLISGFYIQMASGLLVRYAVPIRRFYIWKLSRTCVAIFQSAIEWILSFARLYGRRLITMFAYSTPRIASGRWKISCLGAFSFIKEPGTNDSRARPTHNQIYSICDLPIRPSKEIYFNSRFGDEHGGALHVLRVYF